MRYLFSLITFMLCFNAGTATGAGIRGILKEKNTGLTVEYATVALHDAGTGRMTAGCMTDAGGQTQRADAELQPEGKPSGRQRHESLSGAYQPAEHAGRQPQPEAGENPLDRSRMAMAQRSIKTKDR